jgi:hypothetical protein
MGDDVRILDAKVINYDEIFYNFLTMLSCVAFQEVKTAELKCTGEFWYYVLQAIAQRPSLFHERQKAGQPDKWDSFAADMSRNPHLHGIHLTGTAIYSKYKREAMCFNKTYTCMQRHSLFLVSLSSRLFRASSPVVRALETKNR